MAKNMDTSADPKPCCSFCAKQPADVNRLIACRRLHICDECVDQFHDVITREREEQLTPAMLMRGYEFDTEVPCVLCGRNRAPGDVVAVRGRGPVCLRCVQLVRESIDNGDRAV